MNQTMIMAMAAMALFAVVACILAYMVARSKGREQVARLLADNQTLTALRAEAEQRLADEREQRQHDQQLLREACEQEKALLRQDHEQDLQRLKEQYADQMEAFQDRLMLQTHEMLRRRQDELQQRNDEQMESILRPLRQQITDLDEQLNRNREDNAAKDARLNEMLAGFVRQAADMGAATDKLANAMLSNGKVHGDWGEQVLERILEASGMQRGIHYEVQASEKDEEGHEQRPDVYILCPKDRRIVIDSKVSLTAYANYLSARDADEAQRCADDNYRSVKAQVDRLAGKGYHRLNKDNFGTVLMFIPNEGAYILAMRHHPELGQYAYQRGVVILTPTNLMLTLQLIEGLWQKENEEQNIQNILQIAGTLYEKFAAFSERMAGIRRALDAADTAFSEATAYLTEGKGNVVRQIERLGECGAKYNKSKKVNALLTSQD